MTLTRFAKLAAGAVAAFGPNAAAEPDPAEPQRVRDRGGQKETDEDS